jgi:hypothetical protein
MSEPVKIISLDLENVKRVQLVHLTPTTNGLTVIGGNNCQGKTSILDGIIYGLGGEKYRPTNLQRDGALAPAAITLTLSNGLLVERKGKNASLRVTDPAGGKGGQKILDEFVEALALDLPKFLKMTGKEKADVLLRIIGIGPQLATLENEERAAYQEREAQGRVADQKEKYYKECPWHADVPEAPLSAGDLVQAAQAVMARNAERANARRNIAATEETLTRQNLAIDATGRTIADLEQRLAAAKADRERLLVERDVLLSKVTDAKATKPDADESTAAIEQQIADLEATNAKVRANLDKAKAKDDAEACARQYAALAEKVEGVRTRRRSLLEGAAMPLPGLSIEAGELSYNGKAWDCMSSAEQIRAGVAIVRKLKPSCGFVLLDGLERFDLAQLRDLGEWLQAEGLQAIATRVSKGGECSIVIEDGLVVGQAVEMESEPKTEREW